VSVQALVRTRKGLLLRSCDRERVSWGVEGPILEGWGVFHATVDALNGTMFAATDHMIYGPTVQRSGDGGRTWIRSQKIGLPAESGITLNAVWHVGPGRPAHGSAPPAEGLPEVRRQLARGQLHRALPRDRTAA
jgi:hypothetical protein